MGKITAAITGVGLYLPDYILTNEELSTMVDTSDEWIMSHIGVKTRHILKGEGVGSSYMGARAVINLLDKAGVDPMEVDLVICATVTPDMFFPSTGNLIADQAGCKNAFAYDVSAACSGFLFALTTGAKFIESGSCKKVVVVGADKMSTIVDYTDRSTCPIFGDGAAAVLLEPNTEGYGVLDEILRSDGSGELQLYMKAGGSRYPASIETVQNNWHTIMWPYSRLLFRKWPTCRWRSWSATTSPRTTSVIWFPIRPTCASSTLRPAAWGSTMTSA